MAGYSGTPLPKKLGLREGMTIGLVNAPGDFGLGQLPHDVEVHQGDAQADLFLIFADRAAAADSAFHDAMPLIPSDGAIWVAWPKQSSGVETDIRENTLRDLFLPTGMVDNKVCAIDDTWSGLRFVVRKENRDKWES